MDKNYLKKYCDLVIKTGVNLYPGQCLNISCGASNLDFAYKLAESAYSHGAKFVDFMLLSSVAKKHRINENKNPEYLDYFPDYYKNKSYEILSEDWAHISIDNLEEIDILKGADAGKFSRVIKAEQMPLRRQAIAFGNGRNAWCVVAVPGPVWASKVFNEKTSSENVENLSRKLIGILRLDKDDPAAEWKKLSEKLIKRSKVLTGLKLSKLIFTGEGTNLEIGLNKNSVWKGGAVMADNGRMFLPNIPTEEVYTTPDYKKTNGCVRVTKPVKVMENLLTGIWFEFKNGKVTDFDSDSGKEILQKYFEVDEGASYLGEVALVDSGSEVFKSGVIFNSILYDENAACHIALGRGITNCFTNKNELNTPDEMNANGCNYSLVHTDFMIGSEKINVTGIDEMSNEHEIIKDGKFII